MTPPASQHAITVLGHDRPGTIAEVTARLAELGLNLEDSTMTRLRGHFAMTLICAGGVASSDVEESLAPLGAGGSLTVTVRAVPAEPLAGTTGTPWVLTVHGGDRAGIVSALLGEVAAVGGNVTDLTTRLVGELYLLVAEIDLPDGVDAAAVERRIEAAAATLGVSASLRAVEADGL